ncbi:iron uptake porin [Myxosarcina sp. GI1]|uniref:iron uptake porin n=1 Tax=Myxosarcina sp. GI1 TaxID=1541065 RepID=UPI00068BAB22|nr:iron uptake porin [Myxosarcina sp. GI1]
MKKLEALFTIGISVVLLAAPQVKAQTTKNNNNFVQNYQTNSIDSNLDRIDIQNNSGDYLGQVTNVDSLRDVAPTDWAYEALRSLVNRYGCIAGYPNQTYRGSQALTRYEFAAGLNSCLNQIERLIASSEAVSREDLDTISRLSQEFEAELATLGGRIDNIESRTAFLEDNQFSPTSKLSGEVIFSLAGATGGNSETGEDPQVVFNDRVRLNLNTSFSGEDLLITGLQAYNFGGEIDGSGSIQNSLFPTESLLTAGSTKLSFEPQFPRFNPQDISEEVESNSVNLYKLLYIFPSGLDKVTLFAGTAAEASDAFPTIIPFADEGQGAISRFAALNPVLRVSGGTSQTGLASAAGFIWNISKRIDWRALYASVNAAIPEKEDSNVLGAGLFSGSMLASTQLTLKPTDNIDLGLNYAYSYHELNILATGLNRFSATPLAIPNQTVNQDGTVNVNGILETPVHIHSIGTSFNWNILPDLAFTGYGSYFFVDSVSGPDASSEFLSWMTGIQVRDLLKEGNSAGLIFGQPLNRVDAGGAAELTEPDVERGIPYHLELFYNYKVNDNLSLTPGFFVLFNPEGNENNDTTAVGVLRTTFSF